ncbi:hypothetical protein [Chitinophaga sp. XS-30]|uniref:hypothetical protein n=1 Tax=Chitinophaga sp. XS-30 TaxID=2604421 RepID=UPI0011DC995E|nr:hypothetical protein [Chitinophaga sp. XS-30]QEH41210.1 hypothetical protein FW415_10115 [Chitinophaga sp. XS-30]
MNEESLYIKRCLQEIEALINRGDAARWTNYDFEKLSELIADKTNVQLSVSTLKRVWGKVTYKNAPSLTTLNTLAQFLGWTDWRAYTAPPRPSAGQLPNDLATVETARPLKRNKRALLYAVPEIAILVVLAGLFAFSGKKPKPDPSKFSFSLNKVISEGVPNSVVFTYDATAAQTDSVHIAQTWDIRRKTLVSRDRHTHSAIYYYPGFFNAKLLIDGEVMKSENLQITSDGWLCLAENEPEPLYFKKEACIREDRVEVDTNALRTYNLSLYPKPPRIRFFNQLDLGDLQNDNFIFETTVRNAYSQSAGACQHVEVLIQCKNNIIIIPLSSKNCIGDLTLVAAGYYVTSKNADLSGFGCDLTQWATLRVETENRQMRLSVNGREAYQLTIPDKPTGIVGLQYRFNGVGAVKDTWFRSKGKVYDFGPEAVRVYRDSL